MINEHISEQDLQSAALDNAQLPPAANKHLDECAVCQASLKEYQLLFTSVASLQKPSFDFDVAELVMPLLPKKKKAMNKAPLIICAVILFAGLLTLPFILFDYRIDGLWKTVSPWMMGLVGIVAVVFVVTNIADMYRNYRHQLQKLNFE